MWTIVFRISYDLISEAVGHYGITNYLHAVLDWDIVFISLILPEIFDVKRVVLFPVRL